VSRVGIDIDDVLADFISEYVKLANGLFGKPEVDAQPVDWEWSNFDLTKEQHAKVWDKIYNTRNFWLTLKRQAGVTSQNLRMLAKVHDLMFITARAHTKGFSVQQQSAAWLSLELGLKYPTVIEETSKGPLAAALHLDYFIDDRPKNCLEIMKAVPKCKVFLKDSCHNLYFKSNHLSRVKDFNEFAEIILGVKK
jgi:5'(3')-deoxyribonucleotidase